MAEILIEHEEHGMMHVYSPTELEDHKKLGWKELSEAELKRRIAQKNAKKAG